MWYPPKVWPARSSALTSPALHCPCGPAGGKAHTPRRLLRSMCRRAHRTLFSIRLATADRDGSSVEATDRHPARGMGYRGVNMFVQVIQGHVSDAAQVRAQLDRW